MSASVVILSPTASTIFSSHLRFSGVISSRLIRPALSRKGMTASVLF